MMTWQFASRINWNLWIVDESISNKVLSKTDCYKVCNRLYAFFHLGMCQGVYVQLHASNDQAWEGREWLMATIEKYVSNLLITKNLALECGL